MISGVAGTPPSRGTIGEVSWATWLVDYDLGHRWAPEENKAGEPTFMPRKGYEEYRRFKLNPDAGGLGHEALGRHAAEGLGLGPRLSPALPAGGGAPRAFRRHRHAHDRRHLLPRAGHVEPGAVHRQAVRRRRLRDHRDGSGGDHAGDQAQPRHRPRDEPARRGQFRPGQSARNHAAAPGPGAGRNGGRLCGDGREHRAGRQPRGRSHRRQLAAVAGGVPRADRRARKSEAVCAAASRPPTPRRPRRRWRRRLASRLRRPWPACPRARPAGAAAAPAARA